LAYCSLPRVVMMMENFGGMKIDRGNRNTRRTPAPAPLCPSQIPFDQARAVAVGSQQLTALAMARPMRDLLS
jgi:hypothetical protein